ncbi:MAG: transposase [Leptospiraceae bacterium]|nr:transposase [Leptospiraceae bacterium]
MEKAKEKTRRFWSADEKIGIIREHLHKVKLVDTCDEKNIHPTMFSTWLKQVLEAGREALAGTNKKEMRATDRLLSKHKEEIERKNQIIAELTGEILDLKKELGDI